MTNTRPTFTEADFRKATPSEPNQSCVHVARRGGRVEVRDSKTTFGAPNDHRLAFTTDQFATFLTSRV
jgi:hypothetical protein